MVTNGNKNGGYTLLQMINLTDLLSVSAQPALSDIAALATQGFTVVVCNRPDGETEDQPTMEQMKQETEAAGMRFVVYPVTPSTFPGDDLEGLGNTFDSGEKVFAYCRTGTRSANLWVATRSGTDRDLATETARSLGVDLTLVGRLS